MKNKAMAIRIPEKVQEEFNEALRKSGETKRDALIYLMKQYILKFR